MGGLGLSNTPSNPRSRHMTIPGPGADRANSVLPVLLHPSVPMRMWRCLLLTWLMGRNPSRAKLAGRVMSGSPVSYPFVNTGDDGGDHPCFYQSISNLSTGG